MIFNFYQLASKLVLRSYHQKWGCKFDSLLLWLWLSKVHVCWFLNWIQWSSHWCGVNNNIRSLSPISFMHLLFIWILFLILTNQHIDQTYRSDKEKWPNSTHISYLSQDHVNVAHELICDDAKLVALLSTNLIVFQLLIWMAPPGANPWSSRLTQQMGRTNKHTKWFYSFDRNNLTSIIHQLFTRLETCSWGTTVMHLSGVYTQLLEWLWARPTFNHNSLQFCFILYNHEL